MDIVNPQSTLIQFFGVHTDPAKIEIVTNLENIDDYICISRENMTEIYMEIWWISREGPAGCWVEKDHRTQYKG